MCKSWQSRLLKFTSTPPKCMPIGSSPSPHSWFKKHCSQPSQKQSCIKHPNDTLTNKPKFKTALQKQEHKRRHCPCLKAHICWNHRHAVVPCLTKEKTHKAFSSEKCTTRCFSTQQGDLFD